MSSVPESRAQAVERPASNRRMFVKLAVIAVAMFGFGFAMIPIYKAICEVNGVGLVTQRDKGAQAFARNTQVDTSRTVVVEFDSNSQGAWTFRPERRSVEVQVQRRFGEFDFDDHRSVDRRQHVDARVQQPAPPVGEGCHHAVTELALGVSRHAGVDLLFEIQLADGIAGSSQHRPLGERVTEHSVDVDETGL